jgi:hypothetical protein
MRSYFIIKGNDLEHILNNTFISFFQADLSHAEQAI